MASFDFFFFIVPYVFCPALTPYKTIDCQEESQCLIMRQCGSETKPLSEGTQSLNLNTGSVLPLSVISGSTSL